MLPNTGSSAGLHNTHHNQSECCQTLDQVQVCTTHITTSQNVAKHHVNFRTEKHNIITFQNAAKHRMHLNTRASLSGFQNRHQNHSECCQDSFRSAKHTSQPFRRKNDGTWNQLLWYCLQKWAFNTDLKACEDWMWQMSEEREFHCFEALQENILLFQCFCDHESMSRSHNPAWKCKVLWKLL